MLAGRFLVRQESRMVVTCPACGRKAAVADEARDVVCDCGRRFDPSERPTVADPFLGRELAGYRFEELVGSGGMGTVYRARQLSLGRPVAVKVLPPNVSDDPQFVHRFHREAEILAALSHPNIVQVIDRADAEGRYFIVMEYVDGESLRALLRRGPIPTADACRICGQLLAALDYAHRKGIIHRDIKPENILLTRDGDVKVADFGVSRFLASDTNTRLTRTHFVLGTYEYMAPEQREAAQEADSRSDIYATAVVLYEMLTGELPIGRFDLPSKKLPDVDRRLDAVLEKGLAKEPARRYERASAMAREVAEIGSTPALAQGLDALRDAATRLGRRLRGSAAKRAEHGPKPPKVFDLHLDLLLTVLAVCGILLGIVGVGMLVAEEKFEVGLYDLDRDASGVIVALYGLVLWRVAERARRFGTGSRTMLLALTALLLPTLFGAPITFWTWWALVGADLRAYYEARSRGVDAAEAASLAQGRPPDAQHEAHRRAVAANVKAARVLAVLAFACAVCWIAVASDAPRRAFRDEGFAFLICTWALVALAVAFRFLARQVERRAWLKPNAWAWTILSLVAPKTAARARLLAHKDL